MNPVVVIHFMAGLLAVAVSLPLLLGKVKRNAWYGVRIRAAFVSEAAWYAINRHGGRLFLAWGLALVLTAVVGAFLPRELWIAYNWAVVALVICGLGGIVAAVYRYASGFSR